MMVGRRSFRSTCVHFQGGSLGKLHEFPNLSFLKRIFSAQTKIHKKKHPFCWVIVVRPFLFLCDESCQYRGSMRLNAWWISLKIEDFQLHQFIEKCWLFGTKSERFEKHGIANFETSLMAALKITSKPWNRTSGELYKGIFCRKSFHQFPRKQWWSPKETPTWWHNCTQSMINLGKTAILRQKFGIMMSVNSYSKW